MKITFDFSVTKWGVDIDGVCVGDYSPSTPDVMYMPNGDPGCPGDPAEFYATEISINGKKLSFEDLETFQDIFFDQLSDQADTYYEGCG